MILASFWSELTSLFTQMHWIVILLLSVGVIFCIVESLMPGFGVFGILGVICEIVGIILHAIFSGSVLQVLLLVLAVAIVIALMFLLFVRSAKHGILAKSALVENKPSIPTDFVEKANKELKELVGKEGLTLTECHPIGKIRIGQEQYEARAMSYVAKGEVIKVVKIEDARIVIDKISY